MTHTLTVMVALFFFLQGSFNAISQNTASSQNLSQKRKCGTMEHLQYMIQLDPTLKSKMETEENKFNDYISNHQQELENNKATYTLPVVVHVVYNGTSGYVAPIRVTEQITQTNSDWAGTNGRSMEAFSTSLRADAGITLCLATIDPSGNPTTGIDYKTTTKTSFSTNDGVKSTSTGGANCWDYTKYLNIWVCNLPGYCGYAQFPTSGINSTYGVVIHYEYFGLTGAVAPYDLGGTVSHEFGHCFNLYHTWGDEPNCTGTDYCGDVPNQADATYGNHSGVLTDACSTSSPGIMYINFMDYSDDADYANMTPNQVTRMQNAVSAYLTSVANNAATACAGATAPVADFSADVTTSCTGTIQFTDLSTNTPTSWSWTFGDGGTSTSQNPSHTYTSSGAYTVSLTATNATGSDTETKTSYITISLPSTPTTTNDTICGSGTATLNASGSGTLNWYDASTGGNLLGTGTSYTTPVITTTTTYYVESSTAPAAQYVGNTESNTNGSFFTSATEYYLIFDAFAPFTIVSVEVNAGAAGNRLISLKNSSGTTLASTTINIPAGVSRINLSFDVPVGTDLRLCGPVSPNLYRNTAGITFPYEITGLVSIKSTNADPTIRYYYFYDWEVQEPGCTSSRTPVTAVVTSGPAASVSISANPSGAICSGTSVTFTATATNGGTTPTYQWKKNGSNISGATNSTYTSSTLSNGDVITCVMTSNASCVTGSPATSNSITMTINAGGAASVSIAQSPVGSICAGTSVTFTATPTNGGTPIYQWKKNGTNISGATNSTYTTTTLADGDVITCVMTSSLTCATGSPATSNAITMTVYPSVPVSITIAANPSGGICSGTSVTFTATPTNGGITPAYQWKKNGTNISGATTTTYTSSTLANNDIITCTLTSSVTCASPVTATSNSITMTVSSSLPASISISANPSGAICTGTSVTFTATAANGGSPAYQWKKNGTNISGATNSTYTSSTLANNDIITCVMTSSLTCATGSPATSNAITMIVNSTAAASVSITANPSGAICSGTSVTFTATPTNGGSPTYQWKKNGTNISGATNSTYTSSTLANNDIITCVMTSSLACATGSPATSNSITMTVNAPVAASVSISANPSGAICSGTSVTFTATATNGGTPSYQWQLNGSDISGSTNSIYTSSTLANSDAVTCVMTSSLTCVSGSPSNSNSITMVVGTIGTASVSISASPSGAICAGTSITFTATAANGGSSPTYQWQLNATDISGASNSTYTSSTLADADVITCVMTSSDACVTGSPASSNAITITVSSSVAASVSISASPSVNICSGDNVTFTATAVNGGSTPSYQWQLNGANVGPNSSTVSTSALSNGDVIDCIMTSSLTCATGSPAISNTLTMSVNTSVVLDISITAVPSGSICTGTNVTFTATSLNPGPSPTYQWQVNGVNVGTNSTTYNSSSLTNGDIITCTLTSVSSCATNNPAYSNPIIMSVSNSLPVGVIVSPTSSLSVCEGEQISFMAYPTNGGTSPIYQWQVNSSNIGTNSSILTYSSFNDGDVVTCILTSSLSCASGNPATSNTTTITIYPAPATPVVTQIGDTLFSSSSTGNQWYFSNILGGFAISGATDQMYIPIVTGNYFVVVVDANGCVSDTSNIISIVVGGINEIESSVIELYPNPNNGTFEINYHGISNENAEISLVNSLGQVLLSRNIRNNSVSKIYASHLSSGMYFLKLTTNKDIYLYKVLIAK